MIRDDCLQLPSVRGECVEPAFFFLSLTSFVVQFFNWCASPAFQYYPPGLSFICSFGRMNIAVCIPSGKRVVYRYCTCGGIGDYVGMTRTTSFVIISTGYIAILSLPKGYPTGEGNPAAIGWRLEGIVLYPFTLLERDSNLNRPSSETLQERSVGKIAQ